MGFPSSTPLRVGLTLPPALTGPVLIGKNRQQPLKLDGKRLVSTSRPGLASLCVPWPLLGHSFGALSSFLALLGIVFGCLLAPFGNPWRLLGLPEATLGAACPVTGQPGGKQRKPHMTTKGPDGFPKQGKGRDKPPPREGGKRGLTDFGQRCL